MALNTSAAVATLRGLTVKFDNVMNATKPYYPTKCNIVPSHGRDEGYGMLGTAPAMREWVGDRIFKSLGAATFVIANRKWESSIRVEKDDIHDDRLGIYGPMFEQEAVMAMRHPDQLLFEAQIAGDSSPCFDGQNFFDTGHSWGSSGAQSNKLTGSISVASWAATTAYVAGNVVKNGGNQYVCIIGGTSAGSGGPSTLVSAITDGTVTWNYTGPALPTVEDFRREYFKLQSAILSYLGDNGQPFHFPTLEPIDDFVLEVPTALQDVAEKALLAPLLVGGGTNMVVNRPKIVPVPSFTDKLSIYLQRVGQPLKPYVFQDRQPLSRQMKGLDDREFKDVKFMTDARYNVGYFAWWQTAKLTFN